MCVFAQDAVGQCAVSQQFDRAVEVSLQPFGSDARVGVIIQCFVHAGNGFDLLKHGTDIVADQNNGAVFVDFG